MSKGLEALKEYKSQQQGVNVYADEYLDIIEQELKDKEELAQALSIVTCENGDLLKYKKALEIIKKHPMFYLHDDLPQGTYRMYDCELYSHYDLTQEEYDLLKEVLEK